MTLDAGVEVARPGNDLARLALLHVAEVLERARR
jgi:hypothetical protein